MNCAPVAGNPPIPVLRHVSVDLPAGTTPLAWLQAQAVEGPRLYWRDCEGAWEVAGIGAAHVARARGPDAHTLLETLQSGLRRSDSRIRAFGGLRFDPARVRAGDDMWRGFDDAWFCVPRLVAVCDESGVTRLQANVPEGEDVDAARRALARAAAAPATGGPPLPLPGTWRDRHDTPDRAAWDRVMQAALAALASSELGKIVLARRSVLEFAATVDPLALVQRLRASTRDCTVFCMEPLAGAAFVGASPERLFFRWTDLLFSEALAGTRPRGADPESDHRLGAALLASDKERREHQAVRDMIRAVLEPLCLDIRMDADPGLRRLSRSQHLCSPIGADVRPGVTDADLLTALHPTPAVGGVPTAAALARLRQWEAFDRGWYAAPLGWVSGAAAEFIVAIRSALCRGNTVSLFAGAGIVTGSTAPDEWSEIEHKMQDFAGLLRDGGSAP